MGPEDSATQRLNLAQAFNPVGANVGVLLGAVLILILVSVDGGCEAIKRGIRTGEIDATSQQYPENMASRGVEAISEAARGGEKPSGYLDTGVELITAAAVEGVESKDEAFGVRNCWG